MGLVMLELVEDMTDQKVEIETYTLPSYGLERLAKEIAKLNRRATRINQPHMDFRTLKEFEILDPRMVKLYEDNGYDMSDERVLARIPKIQMTEIVLEGDPPKIEGYELMGTLDHYSIPGSVIVRTVPGQEIPQEFHDREASCDHCNKIRRRVETFVLKETETGKHVAIGRQCVRDFIGYDVAALARFLERLRNFRESFSDPDDERWYGSKIPRIFQRQEVLASTFGTIRVKGWRAKSACNFEDGEIPTSYWVVEIYDPPSFIGRDAAEERRRHEEFLSDVSSTRDADLERAELAMAWLDEQESNNEYMHNLKVLREADGIPLNMFGFWCSLAAAYDRAMDRLVIQKAERKNRLNEWVGDIKERREFDVEVISIRHIDGYYGVTTLHRMIDSKGRTLVWFANTSSGMEQGEKYRIKGTIKKHDEFKDWKQTMLNRVKVLTTKG